MIQLAIRILESAYVSKLGLDSIATYEVMILYSLPVSCTFSKNRKKFQALDTFVTIEPSTVTC